MPVTINPIKKAKVKAELIKGTSARQALLKAGYSPATATGSTQEKVVKVCMEEIKNEFRLSDITAEYVIENVRDVFLQAENKTDKIKALELLGKYLALWKENKTIDVNVTVEDKRILNKYIDITPSSTEIANQSSNSSSDDV